MRRIEVNHGDEYGDLKIVHEVESSGKRKFLCRCSCGTEVPVRLNHLRSGHTASCGQCGVEWKGGRITLTELALKYKIKPSTLRARLKVMGLAEALERGRVR
jgi:hypothetical protein